MIAEFEQLYLPVGSIDLQSGDPPGDGREASASNKHAKGKLHRVRHLFRNDGIILGKRGRHQHYASNQAGTIEEYQSGN